MLCPIRQSWDVRPIGSRHHTRSLLRSELKLELRKLHPGCGRQASLPYATLAGEQENPHESIVERAHREKRPERKWLGKVATSLCQIIRQYHLDYLFGEALCGGLLRRPRAPRRDTDVPAVPSRNACGRIAELWL
jgi:hypothetical protein